MNCPIYDDLDKELAKDNTVRTVLEKCLSPFGVYYLIETNLSFPCFVVGELRADGQIRHLLKCGAEWNARKFWHTLLTAGEQAEFMASIAYRGIWTKFKVSTGNQPFQLWYDPRGAEIRAIAHFLDNHPMHRLALDPSDKLSAVELAKLAKEDGLQIDLATDC